MSTEIEQALNDQANYEAFASSAYLAMESWCGAQRLRAFFELQSAEETQHYLKGEKRIRMIVKSYRQGLADKPARPFEI